MGKVSFGKVLDCFNLHSDNWGNKDDLERKPLIEADQASHLVKLKDVVSGPPMQALQLKPKMVVLKVNMHCNGCARKIEKHISKIEGVSSYHVDMESKMVVISGDIVPFQVLESVSKVKYAELWTTTLSPDAKHEMEIE